MARAQAGTSLRAFRWYRRSRLWVVPTAGAAVAIALAAGSIAVDISLAGREAPFPVFSGAEETARQVLGLIATSIATLTALVLTIVAVVIQLATQALSPRAVRTFLQDAHSHLTIGTFVTTFTYSLIILEQIDRTFSENGVTSTSVTIAFVLAVVSLGMFISYVDHIVHQARVTSIIDRVANETRYAIDRHYPDALRTPVRAEDNGAPNGPCRTITAPQHGIVIEIDVHTIVAAAADADARIVMVPTIGDFVPEGGRLFEVYGDGDRTYLDLADNIEIDAERTITYDIAFGFRLLVDVAERSLSPGINDPTTAVQVLDQLHDLLRRLGDRHFPSGWYPDNGETARLFVPQPSWETFVALAFEEIRQYGASSLQVVRRLRGVLEDLLAHVPALRRPPLERQLRLLDEAIDHQTEAGMDREAARHADGQGIGSSRDGFVPTGAGPSDGSTERR